MTTWLVLDEATRAVLRSVNDEPAEVAGERILRAPEGYPTECYYEPTAGEFGAFVDFAPAQRLTVGRFKLLFTQPERIAIRTAAQASPEVADFLDLLDGFTDGLSLADPMLLAALGQIEAAGLLTPARKVAILAGEQPA